MDNIPLVQVSETGEEVERVVLKTLHKGNFIKGDAVREFEERWSRYVGAEKTIAVSSGTEALFLIFEYISLYVFDKSKKVLLPATSFVATRDAAIHAGFEVEYVDVDEEGLMDLSEVKAILRERAHEFAAVVPVHLYGKVVDISKLEDIMEASRGYYFIVEDACQAHGAFYPDSGRVGSRHLTAWSFMPAKILGTIGDAGAITVPSDFVRHTEENGWFREARDHGRTSKNEHSFPGWKARLDTLKAAVLNVKLDNLDVYNSSRINITREYTHALESISSPVIPSHHTDNRVYCYYDVMLKDGYNRGSFIKTLKSHGISTGIHYPYILPRSNYITRQERLERVFPNAKKRAERTVSLPLWSGMPYYVGENVTDVITKLFR